MTNCNLVYDVTNRPFDVPGSSNKQPYILRSSF